MRILFAEDEPDLNKIMTLRLTEQGYSVDSCLDGNEAISFIDAASAGADGRSSINNSPAVGRTSGGTGDERSCAYDVIILDIMMPGKSGYEVLKYLRSQKIATPVLFLTALDSVENQVKGLDLGANDYLVKPFSFDELMARLRVLTRNAFGQTSSVLTLGDLEMDLTAHSVKRGTRTIDLSAKEYALLEYLMHNAGVVLSREKIEDHIWNFDYEGGTNVVDVYISYLRKKLELPGENKLIHTVRGSGYVLRVP